MENKNIMVYAELDNGKVQSSALELMSKARSLFTGDDVKIVYVTVGDDTKAAVEELSKAGADAVYFCENAKLKIFNVDYFSAAVGEAIKMFDPDVVLMPASTYGEELAPTVALQFKTAGAAHCVDLVLRDNGEFVTHVPAFGGKVIGEILIPHTRPQIASIKPGLFTAEALEAKECEVIAVDPAVVDNTKSKIKAIEVVEKEPEGIPVEKAELIVCGGFGVGSQENWDKLEALAAKMGGTTGCTRPVVDEGWVPDDSKMIGTSGKGVRPKVYVGFGISGAAHHLCGMKDAGLIISVNSDGEAPVFGASDYAVVGDGMPVVDALLEKL